MLKKKVTTIYPPQKEYITPKKRKAERKESLKRINLQGKNAKKRYI